MLLPPLRHLGKVNASRGILHNQERWRRRSPSRARAAANVAVRTQRLPLPLSSSHLTKTSPCFSLFGVAPVLVHRRVVGLGATARPDASRRSGLRSQGCAARDRFRFLPLIDGRYWLCYWPPARFC